VSVEVLEHTRTVRFLIFLHQKNSVPISHIRWQIKGGQKTIYCIIGRLKEVSLIKEETEKEFPWRRVIKLTEKGVLVAEKLEEIQAVLEKQNNPITKQNNLSLSGHGKKRAN
jgi:DNA-binding PadR family transcriptional regulator